MADRPVSEGAGFTADTGRLAGHAKEFDGLTERAGRIAADLDRALAGSAAAWGNDEVGQSFAAAHGGPAEESAGLLRRLPDRLGGAGSAFAEAAARYSGGEGDSADAVRRAAGAE
jgi:hypothetical protein